jgi:DNA mismatch endonuclease (patch repair protein)
VFPKHHKVIFVHGCFWHQHNEPLCWRSRMPKSRQEFWVAKLAGNVARDHRNLAALNVAGWAALIIWECETTPSKRVELQSSLRAFFAD